MWPKCAITVIERDRCEMSLVAERFAHSH